MKNTQQQLQINFNPRVGLSWIEALEEFKQGKIDVMSSVLYTEKRAKNISKANAFDIIFGYTIINDVTARELQNNHKQWFIGKSPDTYCPMGPAVITKDEINNIDEVKLQTFVNEEERQVGIVKDMVFTIPVLIETLTKSMTLVEGDIIATGTPAGVGIGFDPPKFLKPGDKVKVSIEPIGTLENEVI